MVRPDDLSKMFGGEIPEWFTNAQKEPEQQEPPKIEPKKVENTSIVTAQLGILSNFRLYVFYEPTRSIVSPDPEGLTAYMAVEMKPLGKHPQASTKNVGPRMWANVVDLEPGTVVKVFAGYTDVQQYGDGYFTVKPDAPPIEISHPNTSQLGIEGNLVEMTEAELLDIGIKRRRTSMNTLHLIVKPGGQA